MLLDKDKYLNLWKSVKEGGLLRVVPEQGNPFRERGSPMNDPEETWWLLKRLEENIKEYGPIKTIIELGVADGGGLKIWEQVLLYQLKNVTNTKDLVLIGVDWGPNVLWNYDDSPIDIRIIKGDTHDNSSRDKVIQILKEKGDRRADFLFIDAQHHAKDVELDFRDYGGFVRDYGIVGFHDTRLMRSFWDRFTGNGEDSTGDNYHIERAIFHKEEIKYSLGTGIFWKLPNQTVFKFRD